MLRKRRQLRMLVSLLAAAVVTLSAVAAAQAAAPPTYAVNSCMLDQANGRMLWGWSWDATSGNSWTSYFWTQTDCMNNGLDRRFEDTTIPAGATFSWTYTAPANTYITQARLDQAIFLRAPGAVDNVIAVREDGSRTLLASWVGSGNTNEAHYNATYDVRAAGSPPIQLRTEMGCGTGGNCSGFYQNLPGNQWILHGTTIFLADAFTPEFPSVDGAGWSTTPADSSALPVNYSASDLGSGLKEVQFYVDGIQWAHDVSTCTPGVPVPCPLTTSGHFNLDTTKLSEGTHTIAVVGVDYAGNTNAQSDKSLAITVRRPPAQNPSAPATTSNPSANGGGSPAVGDHLNGSAGGWSGDGITYTYAWNRCDQSGANCVPISGATGLTYTPTTADVGHTLVFCVTGANSGGSASSCSAPTPVVVASRPTADRAADATPATFGNGTAQPAPAPQTTTSTPGASQRVVLTAVTNNRSTTQKVGFGKRTPITGRLVGPSGEPVAHAVLSVQVQTAIPGASMADTASVMTGSDGRFLYWAPAGPSRTIRFGYRATTSDASFTDTTDVHLLVSAGVTIKATPKKVRNRQATVFTGRLLGEPLSRRGVVVDLQVFFRGTWRTFGAPRTNAKGVYKFKYRFMAGAATWRFRARVRRDGFYPYETGLSAQQVKVKVTN